MRPPTRTARWATCAIQMPPGHALAALMADSVPAINTLALEDDGIERL